MDARAPTGAEETEASKRAVSEFLDVVVHELRAPLTVATGYISMLREGIFGEVAPPWQRPLELVDEKLAEAQRLVDELLLAARLGSNALHTEPRTVDLTATAERAVARARSAAELVGGSLTVEAPDDAVNAHADSAQVDRILDNLLNNALTHGGTPAEVTVCVGIDAGTPYISVIDNGTGVARDEREHIFERFYRGRSHASAAGSGLGLYLSRQLAELGGGSLELESNDGTGARFTLRLPSSDSATG
ncbi:MAG: sensor histidine kinase [Candidatus Dormibacteria bacterium]